MLFMSLISENNIFKLSFYIRNFDCIFSIKNIFRYKTIINCFLYFYQDSVSWYQFTAHQKHYQITNINISQKSWNRHLIKKIDQFHIDLTKPVLELLHTRVSICKSESRLRFFWRNITFSWYCCKTLMKSDSRRKEQSKTKGVWLWLSFH